MSAGSGIGSSCSTRTRWSTTAVSIQKIEISEQGDGAFAVVDVDTLWRDAAGKDFHWKGRSCKVYSWVGSEWKMTMHTGLLEY